MALAQLHARLCQVYSSVQRFDLPVLHTPVIDSSARDTREPLPGLRYLREEVRRDAEVLDKLVRGNAGPSAISTNAPYLIAVWDELAYARQPIAIYRTFSPANGQDKGKRKETIAQDKKAPKGQITHVKVDIVAENGARWVRVNTIKNSRLMMEFREMDSYLTSDDEDELGPRQAQTEFDNSVLRMARELLAAAKANPIPSLAADSSPMTIVSQVTLRLTRLDPLKDDDLRIEKTIQCLRDMGIDVQLGGRSGPPSPLIPSTNAPLDSLEPTADINLDLSALIALISDISHSPLPRTEEDAHAWFLPSQSYLNWKKERIKSLARQTDEEDAESDEGTWENSGQHSRALAAQAIQEINKGILQEIQECVPSTGVTSWATNEARQRCLQIVFKIGGERERQRADALLGSTLCLRARPVPSAAHVCVNGVASAGGASGAMPGTPEDAYWKHSRYQTGFLPLTPVRIYRSTLPFRDEDKQTTTTFFDALTRMCIRILNESNPAPYISAPATEEELNDVPPAVQTCIPKLTVHTVTSILAGASRGHTTLTTNRSSVKAVLKVIQKVNERDRYEDEKGDVERAALWILDPRSLSEGMRST